MIVQSIHCKETLEHFFRQDPHRYLLHLGDLDAFFWPRTLWYGLFDPHDTLQAVALIYLAPQLPVLLAFHHSPHHLHNLLQHIKPLLPRRFYAHIEHQGEKLLATDYKHSPHGLYHRMALARREALQSLKTPRVRPAGPQHLQEILTLYRESYPGNWFDPTMLQSGQYVGIWEKKKLVSIAGIHVYSPQYRVAALGNITTHPDFREKGLGKQVTGHLCKALSQDIDHIVLNVAANNTPAVRLYENLGFSTHCTFLETLVEAP